MLEAAVITYGRNSLSHTPSLDIGVRIGCNTHAKHEEIYHPFQYQSPIAVAY